jgi:hypothetical protein
MSEKNQNIIETKISGTIYKIVALDNNDLLIQLEYNILCLKNPEYKLKDSLDISIENLKFYSICLWKNNQFIIISTNDLYLIQLYNDNKNYLINLELNLFNNVNIIFKRFIQIIPLNNCSEFLLNTYGRFIIYNELPNRSFVSRMVFHNKKSFQSFFQIKKNEIVCNSENESKVYFIDTKKGLILSTINKIQTFILDRDIFCLINKKILAMAGDLRNGIYFFDINKRELIYNFKEDYRGYNCLLNLGNNKFLGESYEGRSYAESDDEDEELYCTKFYEYNEKENKIKLYQYSVHRIALLKRNNFIKLNNSEKIAYVQQKSLFIENI